MDDGKKTPHGHPDFNSYVKILRVLVFQSGRQTDGRTDGQTDREINLVWASLTKFFQVNVGIKISVSMWIHLSLVPPLQIPIPTSRIVLYLKFVSNIKNYFYSITNKKLTQWRI